MCEAASLLFATDLVLQKESKQEIHSGEKTPIKKERVQTTNKKDTKNE